jgi:hypothetical protein
VLSVISHTALHLCKGAKHEVSEYMGCPKPESVSCTEHGSESRRQSSIQRHTHPGRFCSGNKWGEINTWSKANGFNIDFITPIDPILNLPNQGTHSNI